jgi:hypothetical protein
MLKVFNDKMPQGITRLSIQFIKDWMAKLGLPWPYMVLIKQVKELHLVTSFHYKDAKGLETVLKTDGFSAGYGGEGPCGLKKMLDEFKMVGQDPRNVKLQDGQEYTWLAHKVISLVDPRD